jgi:hypothetical protein
MPQSLYVQTSEGLMNLALVRYTLPINDGHSLRFVFSSDDNSVDCVDLPEAEGKSIISLLQRERPELFLRAE